MEYIRRYIPTVYRRNDRGIQIEIAIQWHGTVTDGITDGITDGMFPLVIPSVKTIIYTPSADTLFLCFSFFFFPIPPLPSQTATTHPNSPLFSTQALKFLIPYTWSQYPFLVDFIIFLIVNLFFLVLTFKCDQFYCFFSICILLTYVLVWLLFVKETCSMNV